MGSPVARDLLGYATTITAADPALAEYLDRLYGAFPPTGTAAHALVVAPAGGAEHALEEDGTSIARADAPEALVGALVNHLNRMVAEACPHVLVHAGGVERDGIGVVLPAQMESGKSTLTAGLVRAGFGYLTDEAVAVDRATHTIVPYPKPISLDPGSWALFPELEPHEPFATDTYKARQWQVPPAAIRTDAVGAPCVPRFVVFPSYEPGAATELEPLTRAEALVELTKNTFRFDREGRPTLEVLAEVVRAAEAYRLPNGDLDKAVAAVTRLVDG